MDPNIMDIPRTYTAIAEWMACCVFIAVCRPRFKRKHQIAISFVFLLVQSLFMVATDDVALILWVPCMMVAAGLMLAHIYTVCDIEVKTAAYTCIRAFILAEFTASLQWQIHCFLWPDNHTSPWSRYALLLLIYLLVFFAMGVLERRCTSAHSCIHISNHELMTTMIIGACIFAVSNLSFYFGDSPFSGQYASEIMNLRTFIDLGGIAILYAYHIQRESERSQRELKAMQIMLETQYAQYRVGRESMDMINRKYHDLKHQIAVLRSEPDANKRNAWLDEMEASIHDYEAQNKTGNSVLDILLTSKSLYCQKHGITFSIVADGSILNFMDTMDICTIFGNALDNAVECERKIPDKSQRMIHFILTSQKQFILLKLENFCPQQLVFQDGFPVSTKADFENHGFGLKSIRYATEKYGGSVTVGVEDNWFVLKILIPIP